MLQKQILKTELLVLFSVILFSGFHSTFSTTTLSSQHPTNRTEEEEHEKEIEGIEVGGFAFEHVQVPFTISIIVIVSALVRLAYHHTPKIPDHVPESCILIILGIIMGAIIHNTGAAEKIRLTPTLFFLFLLPPTILDAAFSLYDRTFFINIGTILLFAIVGTVLACFIIGPLLYGLQVAGAMGSLHLSFVEVLVFASLIVAVDPVAVLAIFQEIGVNDTLYFVVFGESLLNDAVTVVLYKMMTAFHELPEVTADQVFLGILYFLVVVVGATFFGLVYGVLTALITRVTSHTPVLEPLVILFMAYASYITSDMFELSGIISIIVCGLVQSRYTFVNITIPSRTTTKTLTSMLSGTSDAIIFMFLGVELVGSDLLWQTGFILWAVFLCLVARVLVTLGLTAIVNPCRLRKLSWTEQFIMSYGGLRGAVCFSLVVMLGDTYERDTRRLFITATLVVIFFTVFVQGLTIKPLVTLLKIKQKDKADPTVFSEIQKEFADNLLIAAEGIIGQVGWARFRQKFKEIEEKYIKRVLQSRNTHDEEILLLYQQIALDDHLDAVLHGTEHMASEQGQGKNNKAEETKKRISQFIDSGGQSFLPPYDQERIVQVVRNSVYSDVDFDRRASRLGSRLGSRRNRQSVRGWQQPVTGSDAVSVRDLFQQQRKQSQRLYGVGITSTQGVHAPTMGFAERLREKRTRMQSIRVPSIRAPPPPVPEPRGVSQPRGVSVHDVICEEEDTVYQEPAVPMRKL